MSATWSQVTTFQHYRDLLPPPCRGHFWLLPLHSKVVLTISQCPLTDDYTGFVITMSDNTTTTLRPSFVISDQCTPSASDPIPTLHPPCPLLTPSPIYLSQTTPPTLAHWWFSMRRTQLPHCYNRAPSWLFHAPTRTTSSRCVMLHRTVHALWNLYGNPYKNRTGKEEGTVTWRGNS